MTETKPTPESAEAHSDVVGGSSAGRVIACPGSVPLTQQVTRAHKTRILKQLNDAMGIDDGDATLEECGVATLAKIDLIYREETTSPYAEEGTDLHTCMEYLLENDVEVDEVSGRKFGNTIITPKLFEDFVVPALDAFDEYCDLVFDEDGEDLQFLIEERVKIPGVPGGFGTADILGKTSKRMAVLDWKGGAGVPVSPHENKQGLFYGRGAAHSQQEWFGFPLDEKTNQFDRDLRVDIIIVQPRTLGPAWEMWTTTYGRLEDFRHELVGAVSEALNDNPGITQGDHCRWCSAKHICPSKQQLAGRILDMVDEGAEKAVDASTETADVDDIPTADAVAAALGIDFTPEQIADWLGEVPLITEWCKAVTALAYAELEAGRDVPGKGLDQTEGNAAWNIDADKLDRRLASYGLDKDERRVTKSISPTVARKLTKAKTRAEDDPALKEALAKKQDLLEKIIHRPPGKITMKDIDKVKNPVKTPEARRAELKEKLEGMTDKTE